MIYVSTVQDRFVLSTETLTEPYILIFTYVSYGARNTRHGRNREVYKF